MKPSEAEIENLLRHAPQPVPPPELKQQISDQMKLTALTTAPSTSFARQTPFTWWRRWWPALAPGAVSVACAVVLGVQQAEIRHLKQAIQTLSAATTEISPPISITSAKSPPANPVDLAAADQDEIARLQERVKQLTAEITQLEQTQKENDTLRQQIAAPPTLSPAQMDTLTKAKERALSIQCINNLKQFGLAVRIWAMDNNDAFPPDTLSMSNELNTPKILVCPAETNRVVAKNWESFTTANLSYEYLTPSATNADLEPTRVLSRCPIHGHIGLCDGSVQSSIAKTHPEWLIERDGKLYMESNPQPGQQTPKR